MGFRYDFDMCAVASVEPAAELPGFLRDALARRQAGQRVARFRDPAPVEALKRADPVVRDLFVSAGFGLEVSGRSTPEGCYSARDEVARQACMIRCARKLAEIDDFSGLDWGGFRPVAFLNQMVAAEPVDDDELQALADLQHSQAVRYGAIRIATVAGSGLAVLAGSAFAGLI